VRAIASSPNLVTDTWIKASWDEFMEIANHPDYEQGRFYYCQNYMILEMPPDVIAFEIANGRSGESKESLILPGLKMEVVKEAIQRSQSQDDGEVNRWLLEIFS
jgi:hypothetical protein